MLVVARFNVAAIGLACVALSCTREESSGAAATRASTTPVASSSSELRAAEKSRPQRASAQADSVLECTELGCADSLVVEIEKPLHGAYEWRIWHDRTLKSGARTAATPECAISDPLCIAHNEVRFAARPRQVRVEIVQGGRVVRSGSFEPAYSCHRPNGPECDPECCSARIVVRR